MKILFLAPQPFFQERGTPIAVRLALEVLASRPTDEVDLLTYHEGEAISIPHVTVHRINAPRWLRKIGPGISWKKIICDFFFLFKALRMVWRHRTQQYQVIHAVEESVYVAALIRWWFGIPYIYDMDSSLALQLTEKWYLLRPLQGLFERCERVAIKYSLAVVPVCDALATIAQRHGASHTHLLRDVSLLDVEGYNERGLSLREELAIPDEHPLIVYIGNLESYQGIDLLIESFAIAARSHANSHLVVIGGTPLHIKRYQDKTFGSSHLQGRIHFVGPRPLSTLCSYLAQADILASPRVRGNNTPMKIYSYLHSGKPIIATNLITHTQVLHHGVAALAEPHPDAFAGELLNLLGDPSRRAQLGTAALKLAEKNYTLEVFRKTLNDLYDSLGTGNAGSANLQVGITET